MIATEDINGIFFILYQGNRLDFINNVEFQVIYLVENDYNFNLNAFSRMNRFDCNTLKSIFVQSRCHYIILKKIHHFARTYFSECLPINVYFRKQNQFTMSFWRKIKLIFLLRLCNCFRNKH